MTEPHLHFESDGGVAVLTMNRPARRNAYSPEMMCRFADAWATVRDDPSVRVAIVTGAGDTFTSGGDLGVLIPLFTGARRPEDDWEERLMTDLPSIMDAVLLKDFPLHKPVIAAINGHALAGGTELLQACDIRLAVPGATFGLPEAKRGIVPGGGSMVRLARQIPYAKAMEMLLTGDSFSAVWALDAGLINRIVDDASLLGEARALAGTIAANGPLALAAIKQVAAATAGLPLAEAFAIEQQHSATVMTSRDAREGPRAFAEKRPPRFEGR